jgi:hypothetical protein
MFRWLGASFLTILALVVILVVVAIPLLFVYRSQCPDGGELSTAYSFVPPWDDPDRKCRNHQRGFEVVTDEIGL